MKNQKTRGNMAFFQVRKDKRHSDVSATTVLYLSGRASFQATNDFG